MKTLIFFLFFIFGFACNFSHAQKLKAYLQSADTQELYKGIVNDVAFNILDVKDPCKYPGMIYISGSGAKIARYEERTNTFRILPEKDICTITVYTELNKEFYSAGTIVFKSRPLPDTSINGDFRAFFPTIQTSLKDQSFDAKGKTIKVGRFESSVPNAPVFSLLSEKPNSVSVTTIDTVKNCADASSIVLASAEAKIEKVKGKRNIFTITPHAGVKNCIIKIYAIINGKKTFIKSETYRVKKKA